MQDGDAFFIKINLTLNLIYSVVYLLEFFL